MSQVTIVNKSQLFVAAAAIGAAGFVAVPAAHADVTCTVPGEYLYLNQGPRPDIGFGHQAEVIVNANGATLGPGGMATVGPELATYGNASGSIQGRTIDFTITWDDTRTQAHFTGTVGDDGIAHGISTGESVPINLWNPGPWDSQGPLNCGEAAITVQVVDEDVDVYDVPGGVGNVIGILRVNSRVELVGDCRPQDWCQVKSPAVPGGQGWVWGHLKGF